MPKNKKEDDARLGNVLDAIREVVKAQAEENPLDLQNVEDIPDGLTFEFIQAEPEGQETQFPPVRKYQIIIREVKGA